MEGVFARLFSCLFARLFSCLFARLFSCLFAYRFVWSVSSGVDLGARVLPIALDHGFFGEVLGFRLGNVAYTTDCVSLSERAFKALEGVKTWIVGCLRREEHPTHAHLSRVVGWAERVGAERVYLTHMNASMDYDRLCEELPSYIRPAYDFLRVSGEF